MAVTKVTTKVLADDSVTIDKIADAALVTESEGISSNDNDTTIPTSAAVKDYVDTQDATKEDTITGAATTITGSDLTASKALISNASGKVAASTITDTELGHLSGVSSNVQDQFDALTDNDTTYTIAAADGDNTDEEKIVLTSSDASTDEIVLEAGTGLSISRSGDKITFTNTITDTDTVLTTEQVEDIVGAMVSSNSETGITVTYDDTNGKIDFTVDSQTDENFTTTLKTKLDGIAAGAEVNQNAFSTIAVSGQTSVNSDSNTDTLNLAAGTGITLTTDAGTDTVTITSTATGSVTEAFKTISVSGEDDVVADGATDTLTLAAGSNITLTTDAATDTITIASTATGGGGSVDVVTTQHTGDGSTQGFALDSTPGDNDAVQVYLNGVYQVKDAANYSISGSTLTFVTPPTNSTAIEFVHFKITAGGGGGISWDTTVKTAAFTATAGEGYFVDTTSAAITVTLPSSPSAGDEVSIVDYAGTADTNNITITSSDNINGSSVDVKIDYERGGVSMVYVDATQGWIAYNAVNETATALVPDIPLTVDYLVVAGAGGGGAGGGGGQGGGGGAGGYLTSYDDATVSALSLSASTNYTVTVGPGGSVSSNGLDSVFSNLTATGGGSGGGSNTSRTGSDGGSGGGGCRDGSFGGSGNTPSTTPSQGNNGGDSNSGNSGAWMGAGGGGGAGAVGGAGGGNGTQGGEFAGDGGDGVSNSITSTSIIYACGGGGVSYNSSPNASNTGSGGSSGINGGNGAIGQTSTNATAGDPNTGTGGGGGVTTSPTAAAGGSGVVILRYPDTYSISETTSGGNVLSFTTDDTTVSGYKITTFTAGDGTIQFS